MTRVILVSFIFFVGLLTTQRADAADQAQYKSLKDFCVATKKDTPENCQCGQATADRIMSAEEQAIALAMMTGNADALRRLGDKHEEFMEKLSLVTAGCS